MKDNDIRLICLENAIKYNGKADIGSVIGKILGKDPSLKANINEIKQTVIKLVKEVNSLLFKTLPQKIFSASV